MKTIVPKGYKKTKVGIYPDDWKEIEVSKYVIDKKKFCNNDDIPLYSLTIEEGVVPKSQRYERSHLVKDNEDAYKYVEYGDFVYNPMNLRFGALAVHNEQKEVKVSAYYDVFGIKNDKVNLEYLYAYLKSERIMFYYNRMATGSLEEKKRVHYKEFKKFKFPMPLLKEQQKIAQILTTWDAAITKQEELIKEKEQLKKGLMRNLLSGEVRFDGFDNEWEEVKLGDITDIKTGSKDLQDKKDNGEYPFFVRSKNIERIDTYSYNGEAILIPGDGQIGQVYHYVNCKFDYHQRVYKISDSKESILKFIYYVLQKYFYKHAMSFSAKATVDSLRLPIIKSFKIFLPSIVEQQKIAEVLSLADDEINLLKNKLEELKLQKKALMQKLLTGEVRVKV